MIPRHGSTIFCDDIRFEVGNKLTYVGIYYGNLQVPSFPMALPKLCLAVRFVTPSENRFTSLRIVVMKDDEILIEQLLSDMDQSDDPVAESSSLISKVQNIFAHFTLSPFTITEPCSVRVRGYDADGKEVRAGAIRIVLAPSVQGPEISST